MVKIVQAAKGSWLGILLVILVSVGTASAQSADIRWLRSIHKSSSGYSAMEAVSLSSYITAVGVPVGQLIYGYATNDSATARNGLQTFAGLALTTALTYGLKYAIDRPRPYETYADIVPYKYESGHSLPSGHTSIVFNTATCLSLQYRTWYVVAPAYLYAGLVSYSRLRTGSHYPSDVLVGAVVGAGSAWLTYKGQQWLSAKKKKAKV